MLQMRHHLRGLIGLLCFTLLASASVVHAQSDIPIYSDTLLNNWQDWSWSGRDFSSTDYIHSGTKSIKVTFSAGGQGFYVHHAGYFGKIYSSITFWIHGGGVSGRSINVVGVIQKTGQTPLNLNKYIAGGSISGSEWRKVTIPVADLGVLNSTRFSGFWLQDSSGGVQAPFYLDDITLVGVPAPAQVNVTVDAINPIRKVDPRLTGVSSAIWDGSFATQATKNLLTGIKNQVLRFPGGSASDGYHWQTGLSDGSTYKWPLTFDKFADVAVSTGAQVYITANYGSGTAQEAADWVTYSNKTKGYGFKYWEIGNEVFGPWENDKHASPHNPVTYATYVKDYITKMKAADPTIKIGVVVVPGEDSWGNAKTTAVINPRTKVSHNGWTPVLLAKLKSLGIIPDFVIHHRYPQDSQKESDINLLFSSSSWIKDSADLRQQLLDYLGSAGANVELTCTENNSVSGNPGKQTTSLVNALFALDNMGNIQKTEFNALIWWIFRTGPMYSGNNDPGLYGWRKYGDYALVEPSNRPYPSYYAYKLMNQFAQGGDTVLLGATDYFLLRTYAVKRQDGSLSLLVINKSADTTLTGSFALNGFIPQDTADTYSYGIPQDEAVHTGIGSPDIAQSTLSGIGTTFTASFAPYSATVINLKPLGGTVPVIQLLSPTEDTFIRSGVNAGTNYGTSSTLEIKRKTTPLDDFNRAAYLKFDFTSLTKAPGKATLTLTVNISSLSGTATQTLNLASVPDTTWTEAGLTLSTAPGIDILTFTSTSTPLASSTLAVGQTKLSFDITAFVAANLGKMVTLQLTDASASNLLLTLNSREAAIRSPSLQLEF